MSAPRSLAIIVVAGALFGLGLFAATSQAQHLAGHTGLICPTQTYIQTPGFDPLTGEPHGWTERCTDTGFGWTEPPGVELAARRAVPLPVGFLVALAVAGAVMIVVRRRLEPETRSCDIGER